MKKIITLLLALLMVCSLLAGCKKDPEVVYDVEGAAAYVEGLYKEDRPTTSADYDLVSQVIVNGVTYQVEWSVDTDKVKVGEPADGKVVIDVDEKSPEEVKYVLTATVKAGDGTTKAVSFNRVVPLYDVNSHAEYLAAEKDTELTIEGIVVAINSKAAGNKYNHLYLADANVTGGYYCYSITKDPVADLGIQVGMTVKVTGPASPYSGMAEIKDGEAAIIDKTIKTVPTLDITEMFKTGADLKPYVGLPVTIKGVTLGTQALEKDTDQYLNFSLDGKKAYVRTYVTDFPTPMKAEDKGTIDAFHAAHFGDKADATGILVLYNSAPYLIPLTTTPFTNVQEITYTPEQKVATEIENATLETSFSADAEITLPAVGTYYNDVTLAWAVADNANVTIEGGKLKVVVPDGETTATVTLTATCGTASQTKTFTLKLSKTPLTVGEALELAVDSNVLVAGLVVETGTWNTQYNNMDVTIADASGEKTMLVFRCKTQVAVGDYIIVSGKIGEYQGAKQIAQGSTVTVVETKTIAETKALENNTDVVVRGTVKTIDTPWNPSYGNITVTIEDDTGTIQAFRLATNVEVGDIIIITGKKSAYNNNPQIAQGATAVIIGKANVAAPTYNEMTIEQAKAAEKGTLVKITATVKTIDTAWSDTHNNITVTIEDATGTIQAYRLATKVNQGDVITVSGKMDEYQGTKQIAAGATAEIVTPAN